MIARITTLLAAKARPLIIVTASLVAIGALLAAVDLEVGWAVYLAGYASAVVTIPAVAAAHGGRLDRFGRAAFALATAMVALGTPVVAMVATFVLGLDELHLALMPYAMSLPGMVGVLGVNVGLLLVGLAIVRAGVFSAWSGGLIAVAAIVEYPVEFGLLPLGVWAAAVVVFAIGLATIGGTIAEWSREGRRRPSMAAA